MASYKVVIRDERPAWQEGCPIWVEVIQVARDTESQRAFLQLRCQNISAHVVGAVELVAHLTAPNGSFEDVTVSNIDADIAPGDKWQPQPRLLSNPDVRSVEVTIVRADDATTFGEPIPVPLGQDLALSGPALRERELCLREAGVTLGTLDRKPVRAEGWWVCSCGALNLGNGKCSHCGATIDLLTHLGNETELLAAHNERLYQKAASALDQGQHVQQALSTLRELGTYKDAAQLAANYEKEAAEKAAERAAKARRRGIIIGIALVAALAVVFLAGHLVKRAEYGERYNYVQEHYNADDYHTEQYLTALATAGYLDSVDLYLRLFGTNIIVNIDRSDKRLSYSVIGKEACDYPYCHIEVVLPAGVTCSLRVELGTSNGETNSKVFNVGCSGWIWTNQFPDTTDAEYLTIEVYNNDTGALLCETTVETPQSYELR